ncbi:conserved hypothetical protein [Streptomyces griseoflavus Tu4000]|uniref:Uncharacterized protein n=1 Tax=Streptomyces griseoflavus Tu4000 TaxID=467200 RepID=D9XZW2_9ACTN|nr:conserved hypothetical protein [Streptomyces griseoflavus Tu4000]
MRRRSAGPVGASVKDGRAAGEHREAASGAAHGDWLTRGKDGRLTLYVPSDGGLLRWTETAVGGPGWSGPHFVPVAGLTHLAVAQGANGYVHFLGRREREGADSTPGVDIVHAIQYQTGLAFSDWRSLGNPHRVPEEPGPLAVPVGAVARDGTVHSVRAGRAWRADAAARGPERQVEGVGGPGRRRRRRPARGARAHRRADRGLRGRRDGRAGLEPVQARRRLRRAPGFLAAPRAGHGRGPGDRSGPGHVLLDGRRERRCGGLAGGGVARRAGRYPGRAAVRGAPHVAGRLRLCRPRLP